MFLTGYAIGDDVARLAEPADGDSADAVAEIAARHGLAVAYGYPERDGRARSSTPPSSIGPRRRPARELPQDPSLRLLRAATTSPRATSPSSRPS